MKEATIPFQGFYYSVHHEVLQDAVDSISLNDQGNQLSQVLAEKIRDEIDWTALYEAYAKHYTEYFADQYQLQITFKDLVSPKYYNFETDRIFVDIEESEIKRLYGLVDKTELEQLIKERFTSYDGFISHYPNSLEKWPELENWDHNHIGTLIGAYILQHENYSENFEADYAIYSECSQSLISEFIPEKYWKITSYLYERTQRKHRKAS